MPKHQRVPLKERRWRWRPPERRLAIAFARNARGFHAMAWIGDDRVGAQSAYHSAIAIELGLRFCGHLSQPSYGCDKCPQNLRRDHHTRTPKPESEHAVMAVPPIVSKAD